jgi:hypothetical protein
MTDDEFKAVVSRSGLKLSAETQQEIYANCGLLEDMIARVTRSKAREDEPAIIFVPEQRL